MKRLLTLLLLGIFMVGCQKESASQGVTLSFPLEWDAVQTKSDGGGADILMVGVYRKDGDGKLTFQPSLSLSSEQDALPVSGGSATFKVSLSHGRNYLLVFWAQRRSIQDYEPDFAAGVFRMPTSCQANDSVRDAFYGVYETGVVNSSAEIPGIQLKRPFARIQVLAPNDDWTLASKAGVTFSRSAFRVLQAPNTLDLLTGAVSGQADYSFSAAAVSADEAPVEKYASTHKVVASNYILAGDEQQLNMQLDVYTLQDGSEKGPFGIPLNGVKVRRNYNTSVTGNVLTVETGFQVSLDPDFSGTYNGTIPTPGTPDEPDLPGATGVVTTKPATGISTGDATLNASFTNVTGTVAEAGFYWGTSASSLNKTAYADPPAGASGSFSKTISGLEAGTTYYYKAFITEFDAQLGEYVDRLGSVVSFTTESPAPIGGNPGYLNCYEMPAVSGILAGTEASGYNSERGDKWYRYYTTDSKRQIATHTYDLSGKQVRNYIVLYDGSRYAPVWTAHAMHKSMWPDNNVGRNGSWQNDPAISLAQVTGLDDNQKYNRGHLVASNYRQTTVKQNMQTFYSSNKAPQNAGFNGGIWASLELEVAGHAPTGRDTLYVVTGLLYEGTIQTKPSGSLNVPIPSHYYKCLMMCSFNISGQMTSAKGCAYVYTNDDNRTGGITTIDAIEARAGFDFFANVPKELQDAAEKTSKSIW